ncbi:MAG: FIST C-terminal domain-containing protein [Treponema sp.]|nr:FIST C-terminal domain-containing protein [Treponema sp.]
MVQEIAFTSNPNMDSALQELFGQLKGSPSSYKAIIFVASISYDFPMLSQRIHAQFPNCEVMGASTSGEICDTKGFTKKSIVLTTMSDPTTKVSGVIFDGIDQFPIVHKKKIADAAVRAGISLGRNGANKDSFALTFINGLCNAEEATLALLNAVIGDKEFAIAGGSAGDDLQFKQTYVCYNGEVVSHGAAVLFFKTQKKFVIKRENIFAPTGKTLRLTSVDIETRTVKTINNQSPRRAYAQALGISESEAANAALTHPLGRAYGDNVFISSIANFNPDGSMGMYCRVLPNAGVELMQPLDAVQIANKTGEAFRQEVKKQGFVFLVNCILRTIGFEQQSLTGRIAETWRKYFPAYCGFSSYGEQEDHLNFNQTLLAIVIEA